MARLHVRLAGAGITYAPIANDGGPGTVFVPYGKIYQDSANIDEQDGTTTEHFSEESDNPEYSEDSLGPWTATYQVMNPDAEIKAALKGGEVTGTAPNKKWARPAVAQTIEKTVKIAFKSGGYFLIPRAKVKASDTGQIGKNGILLMAVTITALQPDKESEMAVQWFDGPPSA